VKFPVISLFNREFDAETGSHQTASIRQLVTAKRFIFVLGKPRFVTP